jgi:hypothetical protein
MSGENHSMQLRPRRSVLGDISNRASIGNAGGADAAGKPLKKNKRLVSLLPLLTVLAFNLFSKIPC